MLKQIKLHYPLKYVDNVLVKQEKVNLNCQIDSIKKQTVRKVKKIVQLAKQDAKQLAQQGYVDGYQRGIIAALSQTALYFCNCNDFFINKRNELINDVRGILSTAIEKPEILLSVIDEWMKLIPPSDNILHIYLPKVMMEIEPVLNEILIGYWSGKINITYHSDKNCIMSCGQQIAEFSPDEFVDRANETLLNKYHLIPAELQSIGEDSIEYLVEYCRNIKPDLSGTVAKIL
uniref:hypothetical protein n=1 Tax=Yersinia frederiksenii TaxID=29484 RepID=UPI001F4C24A6|nr:hypothetical protein [Yersinia frederiksenii]ULG19989.1 hypothetical protein 49p1_00291 [Yersinia frederiksenii]